MSDATQVVAGVDGCPRGWLCVTQEVAARRIKAEIYPSAVALFGQQPKPSALCIDIPIGLTDKGARRADEEARRRLAPKRSSSVFPSPVRAALDGKSFEEAAALHRAADGRGITKQTFGIYPKIRDIDTALRENPGLLAWVREVHPEVCFWAWNHEVPMEHGKKKPEGRTERRALIDREFGLGAFEQVRAKFSRSDAADDDIADAFAALWTASRWSAGRTRSVPDRVPIDRFGLPMEMCY